MMDAEDMKDIYGDEYPHAVNLSGVRASLVAEGRWVRVFENAEGTQKTIVPRFMDGSASITLEELKDGWPGWSKRDRHDFCLGLSWLKDQEDYDALLRFILSEGTSDELACMASCAAERLPQEEVFAFLSETLSHAPVGEGSNFVQALAVTKHPRSRETVRDRLELTWAQPNLMEDDPFTNWTAFEATVSIQYLLELGADPAELEARVRVLAKHPCSGNRETCSLYLRKHYPWLPQVDDQPEGA